LPLAPVEIDLRHRCARNISLRIVLEHRDDPIVVVEGQTAQDHRVDDREDGGGRRDPEGECGDGDGGNRPGVPQRSNGIPKVGAESAPDGDSRAAGAMLGHHTGERVSNRARRAYEG